VPLLDGTHPTTAPDYFSTVHSYLDRWRGWEAGPAVNVSAKREQQDRVRGGLTAVGLIALQPARRTNALGAEARAAVATARAVVEATAKKRDRPRHDSRQVRALAANGHISEAMKEAAHELGLAGNEVAQGDLVDKPISAVEARGASSWTRYLSASPGICAGRASALQPGGMAEHCASSRLAPPSKSQGAPIFAQSGRVPAPFERLSAVALDSWCTVSESREAR
jgi:hypothetical protein